MADDLEKAILQAYDPMALPQTREQAMTYLSQVSDAAGGWRSFMEKLFGTQDVQVALVCLSALADIVQHRFVKLFANVYPSNEWVLHLTRAHQ